MTIRFFDLLSSLIILIMIFPFLLIISILILLFERRPIFFMLDRVGYEGKSFGMIKFRTMTNNASSVGPYFTSNNDPRITFLGKYLRESSLDELPQFLNVLKGDMSIVGPRPNVEDQKPLYAEKEWNSRNSVKPGITGMAQVYGRSNCTFEERLNYDLEYIQKHSLLLNVILMLKTIKIVTLRKGVN